MKNPPAFPIQTSLTTEFGMSLRDYFASNALSGYMSDENFMLSVADQTKGDRNHFSRTLALAAYTLADAMLAEREKSK